MCEHITISVCDSERYLATSPIAAKSRANKVWIALPLPSLARYWNWK